jgi:hypothetical protein
MKHTRVPADTDRMRLLRAGAAVLAAGGVVVAAGGLLAFAASTLTGPATRATMSICAGGKLRTDRSAQALGIDPHRVDAFDRRGRLVWSARAGEAGEPEPRRWVFQPVEPGDYRVVFRDGGRVVQLDVLAPRCRGGLHLRLNDRGRRLFALGNMRPGTTRQACIVVTYTGNRPARVRLHGRTGGTGLDRHLRLTVVRGWTSRRSSPSCRTFRPDRRNYLGLGRGIVYAGTMRGLPDSYAEAPNDATWHATRTWRRGHSHAYRFVVTLPRSVGNEAQGLTARQAFVWEARSASAPAAPTAVP